MTWGTSHLRMALTEMGLWPFMAMFSDPITSFVAGELEAGKTFTVTRKQCFRDLGERVDTKTPKGRITYASDETGQAVFTNAIRKAAEAETIVVDIDEQDTDTGMGTGKFSEK